MMNPAILDYGADALATAYDHTLEGAESHFAVANQTALGRGAPATRPGHHEHHAADRHHQRPVQETQALDQQVVAGGVPAEPHRSLHPASVRVLTADQPDEELAPRFVIVEAAGHHRGLSPAKAQEVLAIGLRRLERLGLGRDAHGDERHIIGTDHRRVDALEEPVRLPDGPVRLAGSPLPTGQQFGAAHGGLLAGHGADGDHPVAPKTRLVHPHVLAVVALAHPEGVAGLEGVHTPADGAKGSLPRAVIGIIGARNVGGGEVVTPSVGDRREQVARVRLGRGEPDGCCQTEHDGKNRHGTLLPAGSPRGFAAVWRRSFRLLAAGLPDRPAKLPPHR